MGKILLVSIFFGYVGFVFSGVGSSRSKKRAAQAPALAVQQAQVPVQPAPVRPAPMPVAVQPAVVPVQQLPQSVFVYVHDYRIKLLVAALILWINRFQFIAPDFAAIMENVSHEVVLEVPEDNGKLPE